MRHPNYAELVRFNDYACRTVIRRQMTEALTIYIDPDGSAYGDGSADQPFGSFAQAFNYLKLVDGNANDLTIYVADGTYDYGSTFVYDFHDWAIVQIIGNDTNPENVVISLGQYETALSFTGCSWGEFYISGFTFRGEAAGYGWGLQFSGCNGYTSLNNINYGGKMIFDSCRAGISCYDHAGGIDCYLNTITINNGLHSGAYFIIVQGTPSFYFAATTLTIGHNFTQSTFGFFYVGQGTRFVWSENTTINGAGTFTGNDYYVSTGGYVTNTYGSSLGATRSQQAHSYVSGGGYQLKSYTVAQLPTGKNASTGQIVYCSNETGGAVPVFYDGTNWRRVTDRAIAS